MRRLLLLPLLLLLAACGASEAADTKDEPADENAAPTVVSETVTDDQSASLSADTITPAKTAVEAGVIRDRDWSKGPEDPLITIIEYGDFQ